ncbi:MAG: hypothetical protein ABL926_05345 [Novosphingobium sp.]|uniref:hypothetical protein n=1 Tax=Novosphingobium sp. TaxID=1874826 RepID=UPI0032B795C4
MSRSPAIALLLLPLLAACGGGGGTVQNAATRPPPKRITVRTPSTRPPPPAQVQMLPGLEGIIGATSADLVRQFGPARIDVIEGDAHKLQFVGTPCVLDIYLYPGAQGREPQATYVEARRASDGQEVDRISCIGALRRK